MVARTQRKTSASIVNNVITGRGHVADNAQNGIVILGNASAIVKDNTVSRPLVHAGRTLRYGPR